MEANQRALASRGASAGEAPVEGIDSTTMSVGICLYSHQALWHVREAKRYGTTVIHKHLDNDRVLSGRFPNVGFVSHHRIKSFDGVLVLERDWEAVQGADVFAVLFQVVIAVLCFGAGIVYQEDAYTVSQLMSKHRSSQESFQASRRRELTALQCAYEIFRRAEGVFKDKA